jgi:electron transport complex protein RnfG
MFEKVIKPTLILGLIAFAAAFILAQVNTITSPKIEAQKKEKIKSSLKLVLPGYNNIIVKKIKIKGKEFSFWQGEKKKDEVLLKGYAFMASSPGYSGNVISMVGVDEQFVILGLSILQQTETPGLGARCIEIPSTKTIWQVIGELFNGSSQKPGKKILPWFQEQFYSLALSKKILVVQMGDWKKSMKESLQKDNAISSITGATITSKAVVRGLKEGIAKLKIAVTPVEKKVEAKQ